MHKKSLFIETKTTQKSIGPDVLVNFLNDKTWENVDSLLYLTLKPENDEPVYYKCNYIVSADANSNFVIVKNELGKIRILRSNDSLKIKKKDLKKNFFPCMIIYYKMFKKILTFTKKTRNYCSLCKRDYPLYISSCLKTKCKFAKLMIKTNKLQI